VYVKDLCTVKKNPFFNHKTDVTAVLMVFKAKIYLICINHILFSANDIYKSSAIKIIRDVALY
jgi:hypothetical protein